MKTGDYPDQGLEMVRNGVFPDTGKSAFLGKGDPEFLGFAATSCLYCNFINELVDEICNEIVLKLVFENGSEWFEG